MKPQVQISKNLQLFSKPTNAHW